LPADFPAPIVVGHYHNPPDEIRLEEVLSGKTEMPVEVIAGDTPLQSGHIYVGHSDQDIEIVSEQHFGIARIGDASAPSVDRTMATAARVFTDQMIGVLLNGIGLDGLAGAQAIKAYAGTVILQDRSASTFTTTTITFPPTAIDIAADLDAIAPLLTDLLGGFVSLDSGEETGELRYFLERIREQSGIDFRAYKRPTIERRLRRRMAAVGVPSLKGYWRYVDRHPEELQQLISSFLIKVTHFFRDPELFDHLREQVLPYLIAQSREHDRELRIWSAGCATGEEAYSVAIIVADLLGDELDQLPVRIFATDIASDAVDFARHGVYPSAALEAVPADLVEQNFNRLDGAYEISQAVRALVVFGEHDLGRRAPFPRIDLVLCRNVLIYFTSALQRRALQRFAFSLRPGGLMVLGKAESVSPLPEYFALEQPRLKVFRRTEAVSPVLTDTSQDPAHTLSSGSSTIARRFPIRRLAPPAHTSSFSPTLTEQAIRLLDRLSVGVVVIDRAYDIRAINIAARQLLDIRGAGIGEDLIHQVGLTMSGPLRSVIDTAFRGEPTEIVHHLPPDVAHEQGRDLSISCRAVPGDNAADAILLAQIEITDVTSSIQAGRQLTGERDKLATERDELQMRAREAGVAIREFGSANDVIATELGRLRAENEQLQLAHEEIQAAAEEIETLSEEQQAANEELETLNEELQATVEELNTANSELESRTVQLELLAKTLDARRQESEEWFNAIAEQATDYAIFTVDSERRIDSWTLSAQRVFGWPSDEAVGKPFDIIFTPEDRKDEIPQREFETARTMEQAPDTRWHLRQDGARVFIEGTSRARRDHDGSFRGLLKIGRNITERHLREQQEQQAEERSRQELERRVAEATAELRKLSLQLVKVQEDERRHVALELHDEIGQTLTGLQFQLASSEYANMEESRQTVQDLIEQVRKLSMDLRPATLDRYGLTPTLETHIERFERHTGIDTDFQHDGVDQRLPSLVEVTAYRLVQEGLTNLARHSEASSASVKLSMEDDLLKITIRDDGKGFDPASLRDGSGLFGMRDRVSLLGGTLSIDTSPGAGVRISASLPIEDADE
jgi:two-component system CheB/CheR fusion protein